jgi:hypothetical protein
MSPIVRQKGRTSMRRILFRIAGAMAALIILGLAIPAPADCQLAGTKPDNLNQSEELYIIQSLERVFPESMGFRVHAPMEPVGGTCGDMSRLVAAFRVIVPEDVTVTEAAYRLSTGGSPFIRYIEIEQQTGFLPVLPVGYSGVPVTAKLDKKVFDVHFLTVNMDRWLIWARTCYFPILKSDRDTPMQEYAAEVSQYLRRTDFGDKKLPVLKASAVGASEKADLFGDYKPGDRVISEYQELVASNMEMDIGPAQGVIGFTAGSRAVEWLVDHRGNALYDSEKQGELQRAFYDFVMDGRDFQEIKALTAEALAGLEPGWYFYAVDRYQRVRFCPMSASPQDGADRYWGERLKPYECLLFPGQAVLASGEFEIAREGQVLGASLSGAWAPTHRISSVNAFSSYYFYSPDDRNLNKSIEGKSDDYVQTVGHLFKALEDMGVEAEGVLVSKF